jgi:hypothetical protein
MALPLLLSLVIVETRGVMSSSQFAPQQSDPALATPGELSGPPFRFAPPNVPLAHMKSSAGWNEIPPQRHSLPAGFFGTPVAKMYVAVMDDEMDAVRRTTTHGWSTRQAFREAFYRAERRFRTWLVAQPDAVFWGFLRDFNTYDQRVALMTLRYENRKAAVAAAQAAAAQAAAARKNGN